MRCWVCGGRRESQNIAKEDGENVLNRSLLVNTATHSSFKYVVGVTDNPGIVFKNEG